MIDVADVLEVRVNLLPPEVAQRVSRRRVGIVTGGLLGLLLLALGAVFLLVLGTVNQARTERDVAQAEVTRLTARQAELAEFGLLQAQLEEQNTILAAAMGEEVSTAAVLNDLALTFPASSSLRSLNLALNQVTATAPAAPAPAATTPPAGTATEGTATPEATPTPGTAETATAVPSVEAIGLVTFDGYSIERYSPGVESVLLDVDEADRIDDPYVTQAQAEEIGEEEVTGFAGNADVAPAAYTNRYRNGLPPEEVLR